MPLALFANVPEPTLQPHMPLASAEVALPAAKIAAADPLLKATALRMANDVNVQSQAALPTLPISEKPLVFQFSESKAVGSWFNRSRLVGFTRVGATLATGLSGFNMKNHWRLASSVLGLYANIIHFLWSNDNQGVKREITLAGGDWKENNGRMEQVMQGQLPTDALQTIDNLCKSSELPPNAVTTHYDPTSKSTTLSLPTEYFPRLQSELKDLMLHRQEAANVLADTSRMKRDGAKGPVQALKLDGLSPKSEVALQKIIEKELGVGYYVTNQNDGRWLNVAPSQQADFTRLLEMKQTKMGQRFAVQRQAEAPAGFWESVFRPDKFPWQSSIVLGGFLANVLRFIGTQVGDKGREGRNLLRDEAIGVVISQIAYFIEAQRELNPKPHVPTAVDGANPEQSDSMFQRSANYLNEHPMIAAGPAKAAMLYFRTKDAMVNKDDKAKVFSTVMDWVTAGINLTIDKRDYGGR